MELSSWKESSAEHYLALGATQCAALPEDNSNWRIVSFDSISSTMDIARQWERLQDRFAPSLYLLGPAPHSAKSVSLVFVARAQHAGRGRQGNSWISAPDRGLFITLLWNVGIGVKELAGFSIAAGAVVAESLEAAGIRAKCKWPNDIVIEFPEGLRKLGGLLIETWRGSDDTLWVSAGIGINLRSDTALTAVGGVSAEELGVGANERGALFGRVVSKLTLAIDEFSVEGLKPFLGRFESRSALAGKVVQISRPGGSLEYQVLGVSSDGGLRVKGIPGGSQEEVLYAGEVSLSHAYCR